MPTEIAQTLLKRWIFVLVRCGADYLTPYTRPNLARIAGSGEYGADFPPLLERVLEALQDGAFPAGSYYPGGWYRSLVAGGQQPGQANPGAEELRRFYLEEITVREDGTWHLGEKPIIGQIATLFLRNLHFDGELKRYFVRYAVEGEADVRYLHHMAPPIRVRRVEQGGQPHAGTTRLHLNTGETVPLAPGTLHLDAREHLYCAVRGNLPARFDDVARWDLLKDAAEAPQGWRIPLGGGEILLREGQPWPFDDPVQPRPLDDPVHPEGTP